MLVIQRLRSFKYKASMLTRAKETFLEIYTRYDGDKGTSQSRKGTFSIRNKKLKELFYFYYTM